MAGRGGKRPRAGRPKGAHCKFSPKALHEAVGEQAMRIAVEWLNDSTPAVRRAGLKELLPYLFQKQPVLTEITGTMKLNHAGFDKLFTDLFGGGTEADAFVSEGVAGGPSQVSDRA